MKKYIANLTLSGIIMAVTDVFDALTSKRSYKEPFPFAESVCIISDEAGKHFDPVVVRAFLSIKDALKNICETSENK